MMTLFMKRGVSFGLLATLCLVTVGQVSAQPGVTTPFPLRGPGGPTIPAPVFLPPLPIQIPPPTFVQTPIQIIYDPGVIVLPTPTVAKPAILPPKWTPQLLNNFSLQTVDNTRINLPNQIPYSYIATRSEDWRIDHNGVPVPPTRLQAAINGLGFSRTKPSSDGAGMAFYPGMGYPTGYSMGYPSRGYPTFTGMGSSFGYNPYVGMPYAGTWPTSTPNSGSMAGFNPFSGFDPPAADADQAKPKDDPANP